MIYFLICITAYSILMMVKKSQQLDQLRQEMSLIDKTKRTPDIIDVQIV